MGNKKCTNDQERARDGKGRGRGRGLYANEENTPGFRDADEDRDEILSYVDTFLESLAEELEDYLAVIEYEEQLKSEEGLDSVTFQKMLKELNIKDGELIKEEEEVDIEEVISEIMDEFIAIEGDEEKEEELMEMLFTLMEDEEEAFKNFETPNYDKAVKELEDENIRELTEYIESLGDSIFEEEEEDAGDRSQWFENAGPETPREEVQSEAMDKMIEYISELEGKVETLKAEALDYEDGYEDFVYYEALKAEERENRAEYILEELSNEIDNLMVSPVVYGELSHYTDLDVLEVAEILVKLAGELGYGK